VRKTLAAVLFLGGSAASLMAGTISGQSTLDGNTTMTAGSLTTPPMILCTGNDNMAQQATISSTGDRTVTVQPLTTSSVPEPTTLGLVGSGILLILVGSRKRKGQD
jgi:hypothetical protein